MIKQLKKIKRKVVTFFQTPQEKRHALVGPAKLWKMKQDFQINFLKSCFHKFLLAMKLNNVIRLI